MSKQQASLSNRVRAIILLTSVIVLLATATAFAIFEIITYKAQMVRRLSTLAAVIADNSAAPLAFQNDRNATDILAALQAEPEIAEAALYDLEGKVFASYPATLSPHQLPTQLGTGEGFREGKLILFQPVIQERKPIGTLYIRSTLKELYQRFWRYGSIVIAVLAGSLAAAFVLSTFLQKRISSPILALTRAAEAVAERGDYSIRAPKMTEDELGTLTDAFNGMISQIQEHQGRLAEQARLLNLTFDAIVVRDAHDRITDWKHGAEEMYGFTREEALGKISHELLQTEFPQAPEQIFQQFQRENRWLGELMHSRKDGSKIHVVSRWALDRNPEGKHIATLEVNTDISERKAFQAELVRLVAERTAKLRETVGELEAFSYSVSHDMRAPLRAMQGYADTLLTDYKDRLDPQGYHYLERICRASHRLDSLVQDVLSYSKVAKGEIELHAVDLERLVDDILSNHPEFQPPRAIIALEKPLHAVLGHEAYLTQCVSNLLGNAVKFVPKEVVPKVRLRTDRNDGKIILWIEDNGIGIAPSHLERIFMIFGKVHGEKEYEGTGIGLAIVRKAAQRMDGEVGVESELGKGSRFWITLRDPTLPR